MLLFFTHEQIVGGTNPNCFGLFRFSLCETKGRTRKPGGTLTGHIILQHLLLFFTHEKMVFLLLEVSVQGFAAAQLSCLGPPYLIDEPPYLLATFHGGSSSSDVNQVDLRPIHTLTHGGPHGASHWPIRILRGVRPSGVRVHSRRLPPLSRGAGGRTRA